MKTNVRMSPVLLKTCPTQHLPTAVDLLRVSSNRQTDETDKIITEEEGQQTDPGRSPSGYNQC